MTEIRVGFNKLLSIMAFAVAGLNVFTFALSGKAMYGGLAVLFVVVGILQLFASAYVVAIAGDGSGEIRMKNALGMTLRRYPFAKLSDLEVDSKLHVTLASGERKSFGGWGVDGGDKARLRDELTRRTQR